jgi:hypothetical protein
MIGSSTIQADPQGQAALIDANYAVANAQRALSEPCDPLAAANGAGQHATDQRDEHGE